GMGIGMGIGFARCPLGPGVGVMVVRVVVVVGVHIGRLVIVAVVVPVRLRRSARHFALARSAVATAATAPAVTSATPATRGTARSALLVLGFGLRLGGGLLLLEGFPIGHRDLVVVGMDLAEGEKAVAIAAVLDEGGLE